MSAFHVCSQLLSSLSSYQYTLKAWRKDVLELLLDPNTFRMLPETLPYWRALIDNLCTHDKTVFKELLGNTGQHVFNVSVYLLNVNICSDNSFLIFLILSIILIIKNSEYFFKHF